MANEWVVLELSPKAEGEDPDFIRASIRHQIRDAEIYLPVSVTNVGEDRLINYLVDGYAFIKRAQPDEKYYKLEGSRYVQSVITKIDRSGYRAVRKLACATDADIDRFKSQIHDKEDQGIDVGDTVLVTSGPYRQIRAVVIEDIPENLSVQIHVKLRSKESIVTLPRSFLRLVEKAPRTSFLPRLAALRDWLKKVKPFVLFDDARIVPIRQRFQIVDQFDGWIAKELGLQAELQVVEREPLDARPVARAFVAAHKLHGWYQRGTQLVGMVKAAEKQLDPTPIRENFRSFEVLHRWADRLLGILPLFTPPSYRLATIEAQYLKWMWFEEMLGKVAVLNDEVEAIERTLLGKTMTDNIIIDGHNLAVRCSMSPGLDTLKDSKGRPTGAIVGFLRSLGSFLKRFPGGKITVVWDGSSQRRTRMFTSYKANRLRGRTFYPAHDEWDQFHWLRETLPLLGIKQAWNVEEEADDVVATLVRGAYRGQQNVVISTDRDFLQLVSATDQVWVPAVGAGKEKLYNAALVEKEYGTTPDRMVHFRAIDGDTSDNIPGVPGFGPKMASKLLKLYGTVDGIFSSNLAGLTPVQYQKLRAAEQQVRLNVELMTLQQDLQLTITTPDPDQNVASQRLLDVDVKVESILPVFFPAGDGA